MAVNLQVSQISLKGIPSKAVLTLRDSTQAVSKKATSRTKGYLT